MSSGEISEDMTKKDSGISGEFSGAPEITAHRWLLDSAFHNKNAMLIS